MQRHATRITASFLCAWVTVLAPSAYPAEPASKPGIDAPELAHLGAFAVGFRTLRLVQPNQPALLELDPKTGRAPLRDRILTVDVWYPAKYSSGAKRETYTAVFTAELPGHPPVKFSATGLAVRGAAPAGGGYPLVIVSHGYGNSPAAMAWLTENLASKGYVVAAIHHEDPYGDQTKFAWPFFRRPLDIAFVAASLQSSLSHEGLIDPLRTALIGYSLGAYGVLASGGATLDPAAVARIPGGYMVPYGRGGEKADDFHVKNLKAIVAMAAGVRAWDPSGTAAITVPLLLISGDADHTVDYLTGARTLFEEATGSHRYLLTFKGAGHNIGLGPTPESMRHSLWDLDWFEDPIWRKDRILAINLHFITAFLDLYLKDDQSRAAYLDVPMSESSQGTWAAPESARWGDYSPGTPGVTLWKGFQRRHAEGLALIQRDAETPVH
jgi:predicted dienelactone hydrolase